tara:strand:+ start:417 stop:578 length:162 start_codon:yes stop_codon:yes gene_type:complete
MGGRLFFVVHISSISGENGEESDGDNEKEEEEEEEEKEEEDSWEVRRGSEKEM